MGDDVKRHSCALQATRMSVLSEICTSFSLWGRRPTHVELTPRLWAKLSADCWPHVDDRDATVWIGAVPCRINVEIPTGQCYIFCGDDRHTVEGWDDW